MSPKVVKTIAILVLFVLGVAILTNSMTKPMGRDEQMYCTGGVLLAQGKMIYKDFSYAAQLPYHPLLYAVLFRALNTTYYLLTGRMVSVICDVLVMLCIVGIYQYIFRSFQGTGMLLGLAGAILYVFNPLVDYANGYAWNHDVVILCVVLSFWLFVSVEPKRRWRYWRIAAIGALLTVASCMRITTAIVQLIFFAALLVKSGRSIKQRFKTALPFLAATAIVLVWPIWVIVQAPRAFFLNLYWIPMLYGKWLHETGMVYNKLDLTLSSITTPGYFVLIILLVYLSVTVLGQYKKLTLQDKQDLLLSVLLMVAFFIIAFIPPTMWRQYLGMPVAFLIISAAYPLSYLRRLIGKAGPGKHFKIACASVVVCVFVAVASYPVVIYRTALVLTPVDWVPMRLHRISEDIAEKTKEPKLILTLAPLFALEGGCNIYTELSCGAIIYRVADRLSPWNRDITHTIGPRTLRGLIEESPPSAVLLGVEEPTYEESVKSTIQLNLESWKRETYPLIPPLSLLTVTYQSGQQLLLLYH